MITIEEGELSMLNETREKPAAPQNSHICDRILCLSKWKKLPPLQRKLSIFACIGSLIGCILIVAFVIVYCVHYHDYQQICNTKECNKSATLLMQSIDHSVDPCDNFYNYVCGNWKRDNPLLGSSIAINYFILVQGYLLLKIGEQIQQQTSDDEPLPVTQAKMLYRSCLDTDTLDRLGLDPMYELLKNVELPLQPPLISSKTENETTQSEFNWLRSIVRVQRATSLEMLIALEVRPAVRNNTYYRIAIRKPGDTKPLSLLDYTLNSRNKMDEYRENDSLEPYIYKVLQRIFQNSQNNQDLLNKLRETAGQVASLMNELQKIEEAAVERFEDEVEMSIEELQKLTEVNGKSQVNWTGYFTYMYEGLQIVPLNLTSDYKIVVKYKQYFQSLAKILSQTPRDLLQATLWWKLVDMVIPHTDSYMRQLYNGYLGYEASSTVLCTAAVKSAMEMAVGHMMAEEKFFDTTNKNVEDMLINIRSSFSTMVEAADWLDNHTKISTLEKVESVTTSIGFPDWILDKYELENYYKGVVVSESTFLLDIFRVLESHMTKQLHLLGTKFIKTRVEVDPLEVNAYYGPQLNKIVIPAAILRFPFYGLGLEALNYGAIGSTVGHELTHGFDSSGWKFDKDGNLRDWWSNTSAEAYVKRTQCFINQFDQYELEGIPVNGTQTLAENIADGGGLKASLLAYQTLIEKRGTEPKLPGFANFTHEQLFFLSYANSWCESWSLSYLQIMRNYEHAPLYYRVIGSLSNSEEFSRVWNCPKGSPMNPEREKCKIW